MKRRTKKRQQARTINEAIAQKRAVQSVQFDTKQSEHERLKILYEKYSLNKQVSFYEKLRYKGQIFNIDTFFSLNNLTNQFSQIVKLKNIIQLPQLCQELPFVEVEWYLRREELPLLEKYRQYYQHMSKAQLFPSGKIEYLQVEAIDKQVQVISNKEYENLPYVYDTTFFTRAAFDCHKQTLVPEPSQWQSSCICRMPVNPQKAYTQCESCELWFHIECVTKGKQLKEDEAYICEQCHQAQVLTKNSKKNDDFLIEKRPSKKKNSKGNDEENKKKTAIRRQQKFAISTSPRSKSVRKHRQKSID